MTHKERIKIFTGISAILIIERFNGILVLRPGLSHVINLLILLVLIINIIYIFRDDKDDLPSFDYLLILFLLLAGINAHDKFRFFLFLSMMFFVYLFRFINLSRKYPAVRYAVLSLISLILSLGGAVVIRIKIPKTLPLLIILLLLSLFEFLKIHTQHDSERSVEENKEGV